MSERPDNTAEMAARLRDEAAGPATDLAQKSQGILPFFWKRMGEQHVSSAAAALTFSTTLAIVPAMALILAGLAAFPAFDKFRVSIQNVIVNNLVPDMGLKVSEGLNKFIEAAGQLTVVGIIGLVITAILLLLTIEGQLNLIFHVTRPRPLLVRLLIFWAVMTVGPFFLGLGLTLFGYFSAAVFIERTNISPTFAVLLGNVMPTLLTWAVIAFTFKVLPNRHGRLGDALMGAAVAAVLLAILRYTFAFYVVSLTTYQAVYGALAAVPVFLVWLYLVWLFVMAGAVVAAGLPEWRYMRETQAAGSCANLLLGLQILACLDSTRKEGQGWTRQRLLPITKVSDARLSAALETLRKARFVAVTTEGYWMLNRDLERTPFADLIHHFGFGYKLDFADDCAESELGRRVSMHLNKVYDSERTLLSVSLARLIAVEDQPSA